MNPKKRYLRFCGIDIAKNKHVLCVIDKEGRTIVRSRSFANDNESYQRLLECLKNTGRAGSLLIGMEATGHYWYGLHDFLTRHGYQVVVLNPIQTAMQAKKGIRKCKTDQIDAFHIAMLLKNAEYKTALVPGEFGMTCRQLTRLRYSLIEQGTKLKQLIWSRLHPVWPEFEEFFANPFCATGRKLLTIAPTPADVLKLGQTELAELIRKTSRGKYGPTQTKKVWQATVNSAGMQRGLEGTRIGIRTLLHQMETMTPVRENLEAEIRELAQRLPAYIFTLPGIDPLRAVSVFGETDPIQSFPNPAKLVAFAGLDLTVYKSGNYDAPHRHISKRGSPFLRHTLWSMAFQAIYREGDLRNYWLRKHADGLKHKAAVTAAAIKLCHITWRILTDKRDYLPQGCPN